MTDYKQGWVSARPVAWGLSGEDLSKDPQFAIAFEIVEGEDEGKKITWYGTFASDAAFEYTVKAMKRCGWTGTDLTAVELAEAPVSILIEEEEYNGKWRTKVKGIGNGGGGVKQMDPNAAKAFAAKMANRIKAFDLKNGTAAPAKRPAPSGQQRTPAPYGRSGHGNSAKHSAPDDDFDGYSDPGADDIPF